ncbi:hypothetical protein HBI56_117720 [Parastagonospora nodorum]|nr:hypothetical protein HBI56_117720 [Parastagonospora nodorum]
MLQIYYIIRYTNNARNTATKRDSLLSQTYEPRRYASSNKGTPILSRTSQSIETRHQARIKIIMQPKHESILNKKTAPLLVCSSIATTPYRNICSNLQTHIIRQARIEVTAAYALNYLKLRVLKLTLAYRSISAIAENQNKFQFLSANIIALIGTVLYNAIKEYHNNRTRKTIYFHSHTIETIHANYIKNSRSNVTMPDDYHDNDVNNILIKYTDNERQQYNTLIEDYNRAGKQEDNILTIDKCRTGHSNKKDIEANEREEETRVQLRELLEKIHDILLREFHKANDFIESVTHNDDEQKLELEDCNALVERYKEEINCSDLYSTV